MKIFAIASTVLLASVAYAAPALFEARFSAVEITFIGAAIGSFTQFFSTDNTVETSIKYQSFLQLALPCIINNSDSFDPFTDNSLSVSKIQATGGVTCILYGIDGSATIVVGKSTSMQGHRSRK